MVLILLMGVLPRGEPLRDRVDLVEVNHTYDDNGKLMFCQVIFWAWSPEESAHRVVAWRMSKEGVRPRRDHRTGEWVSRWQDTVSGEHYREVRAATFRESWTQFDPEREDQSRLPKDQRRGLMIR